MKYLAAVEVNSYLEQIGMKIGDWNEIAICGRNGTELWTNYKAPNESLALLNFSFHVAAWLPRSEWKLIQFDNSTYLDVSQRLILSKLLGGDSQLINFGELRSFVFEFKDDSQENDRNEIVLGYFIYFILLYEAHVYIVASNGAQNQRLGLQDGFVYFSSAEEGLCGTAEILGEFEANPNLTPGWVSRINSSH